LLPTLVAASEQDVVLGPNLKTVVTARLVTDRPTAVVVRGTARIAGEATVLDEAACSIRIEGTSASPAIGHTIPRNEGASILLAVTGSDTFVPAGEHEVRLACSRTAGAAVFQGGDLVALVDETPAQP
nr:hypothetical protein [Actinomycetota bacterium]